jgi:hypothetical protein
MGGGGRDSAFFRDEPETVVDMFAPDARYCESVRVADESPVTFLETGRDLVLSLVKGFGEEAKFLKEGSDIRGAFHGNRRMTMQLLLAMFTACNTKR